MKIRVPPHRTDARACVEQAIEQANLTHCTHIVPRFEREGEGEGGDSCEVTFHVGYPTLPFAGPGPGRGQDSRRTRALSWRGHRALRDELRCVCPAAVVSNDRGREENTAKVHQGVEAWNAWRAEHPDETPDLSEARLDRADLDGADLAGARLERAILLWADLRGARLTEATLEGAHIDRANLSGARLEEADLSAASLIGAYLGPIFLGEDVVWAGAILTGADLSTAGLYRADLSGTTLLGARLDGADLTRADLRGADLRVADLRGARFDGARWDEARYDSSTRFPRGLDPEAAGMVFDDES